MTPEDGYFPPAAPTRFDELFAGKDVDPDLRSYLDGVPGVTLPPTAARRSSPSEPDSAGDSPWAAPDRSASSAPGRSASSASDWATSSWSAPRANTEWSVSSTGTSDSPKPASDWAAPAAQETTPPAAPAPSAWSAPAEAAAVAWPPPAAPAPRAARSLPADDAAEAMRLPAYLAPVKEPVSGLAARAGEVDPILRRQIPDVDTEFVTSIRAVLAEGASDLHLCAESTPVIRIDGELKSVAGTTSWSRERIRRVIESFVPAEMLQAFEKDLELDLAYSVGDVARFRVNIFQDQRGLGAALRIIPTEIKSVAQLGLPSELVDLAHLPRGLVLVCGPTGSGKSTTLAAIIDKANASRASHIVTVEDPIEFLHHHKRGIINQREVGADTHGFSHALKHALRQDPDIILVGELRDLETISTALTAAETGHLVFATLHTQDVAQTIDRIIDVYPSHQQAQVRTQLAATVRAIVVQTLIRRAGGKGRTVATEVMFTNPAIASLIRSGKTHQMRTALQAGSAQGMHTLDQDLARLVLSGEIAHAQALDLAQEAAEFEQLVRNRGLGRDVDPMLIEGTRQVAGGMGGPS
ncbi:type IV pilus twitching motility protein PilT [Tessaracoccus palaemonis]|uniref:PilT/PilU family type 4a pilus ATPase n=1 Tax=Tessaracoccus palaemonis TaxID=2829499 RepID=A0ABX8SH07_9ACTN|nr:type IV pilus twitching motility protein PilT [Tessaracoccus palaemonis]QXT62677.1 PilT/PilU family type 4a pilus ATPase [Tessaracoccus palaemonis]